MSHPTAGMCRSTPTGTAAGLTSPTGQPPSTGATSAEHRSIDATTAEGSPRAPYGMVLLLACGATFMGILDSTAVSVALPNLRRDFTSSSLSGLSWVLTIYTVSFAAVLAPAGRLADAVGRARLFRFGVVLFAITSLGCALAPGLGVLLAMRGLQGACAAVMVPASLAIILTDSPPARRTAAIGAWSAAAAAGAATGPLIGGVLIGAGGWRAVFLINLPLGILLGVLASRLPRQVEVRWERIPDLRGILLLGGGAGLVAFGVANGATWTWTDSRTMVCLAGGVGMLMATVRRSRRHPRPALEMSLWGIRTFAVANLVSVFFGAFMYAWFLMGSLFLSAVWGYSETEAGLAMAPAAVTGAVVSVAVGHGIADRYPRTTVLIGSLAFAGGAFWQSVALPVEPRFLQLWLPTVMLCGAGIGATLPAIANASVSAVAPARFAGATGMNMAVRQLGGSLGLAALATIVSTRGLTGPEPFADVATFTAYVAILAALAGIGLALGGRHRRKAPPRMRALRPQARRAQRARRVQPVGPVAARPHKQTGPILMIYWGEAEVTDCRVAEPTTAPPVHTGPPIHTAPMNPAMAEQGSADPEPVVAGPAGQTRRAAASSAASTAQEVALARRQVRHGRPAGPVTS